MSGKKIKKQWEAFIKRIGKFSEQEDFDKVCVFLWKFLEPPTKAIIYDASFRKRWKPGQGWT